MAADGQTASGTSSIAVERRRRFLTLAWRRHRPARTGSSTTLLASRTSRVRWPDLRDVLQDVPWAVCGAVATRLYMPERATADLDILIHQTNSAAAHRLLEEHGFLRVSDLGIGGATWRAPDGVEVDVIERADAWVAAALDRARMNRDLQGLPILPLPYQVLMKLQASRGQDLADLLRMLGAADDATLGEVRRVVREFAPADVNDLQSLIELGRLEQATDEP